MEHPHTVLLNKVLEANIALGNAHANKLEYSKIVRRWMDLQQSANVMFDSKQAGGKFIYLFIYCLPLLLFFQSLCSLCCMLYITFEWLVM